MATHSSTLAQKIPWTEEPGGLQPTGVAMSQTRLSDFTFTHWRRKWRPTPVFLPGESQGRGSLVGCHLWGRTGSDTTEATQQQQQQQPHLLIFAFVACAFVVIHQKLLLRPTSKSSFPMLSSGRFTMLDLLFKSLIYFQIIFVGGIRQEFNFIILHVHVQFSHHLWKRLSFPC